MNRFFTLLFAAFCLTAVGQVPDYVPTDGLVAWLNLNADGIDEFGSYSALLVGGHESPNRYGSCGGATGLDYSGAYDQFGDHFELGAIPEIAYSTDLSVGIWFNADVSQQVGQGGHNMLWSSGRNQLYLSLTDAGVLNLGGSGFCSEIGNFSGQEVVSSNVWHHVVVIVRDSILELWFDGDLVEQENAPSVMCNADQFWIGSMFGYAPHGFVGDLDEFGIWSRPLVADEVIALYESQIDGLGCTDSLACNYDETAVLDDGSCVSCDVLALACGTGTIWDPFSQTCIVDESACGWQPDGNGDNLIGVNDLLDLLGVYGDTDYDQDGIWDSADDCVGEYDECGVCNGSGPSIPIIESIVILYDSVYAEQIDEWFVFEVGADTTFSYTCFEWQCGDPLEYQGYGYETVQIGEQCWFAENLRAEEFSNGESIAAYLAEDVWESTSEAATDLYGFTSSGCTSTSPGIEACDSEVALDYFGRLYNWFAVSDSRGLCPAGWHVPSDEEFVVMEVFLGIPEADAYELGFRGDVQGNLLKTAETWANGVGDNSVGFGAQASGKRPNSYIGAGNACYFWTSTDSSPCAWFHYLYQSEGGIARTDDGNWDRTVGASIRCIKDTE